MSVFDSFDGVEVALGGVSGCPGTYSEVPLTCSLFGEISTRIYLQWVIAA